MQTDGSRWTVPCWACGEEMPPGLSWHRDHDARGPLERAVDAGLGIDSAARDRQMCAQPTTRTRRRRRRTRRTMSERPPEQGPPGGAGADKEKADKDKEVGVQAIVLSKHEEDLWRAVAQGLDEPIGVVYRLCALSGAAHYLAERGKMEQAALAGALLRLYAESKGIEVQEHEPHTREVQLSPTPRRGGRKGR